MGEAREKEFWLLRIDRRWVYLAVAIALAAPLVLRKAMPPAKIGTAETYFKVAEEIPAGEGKLVLIAMDWGPGTQAENKPQTEMMIRHLMHRGVKFGVISCYYLAEPYLLNLPQEVADDLNTLYEGTGRTWKYGTDWVNFGYRPGWTIMVQGLAKSGDLHEFFKDDAAGTDIGEIECMRGVKTIKDIPALAEFTGLVGAVQVWLQFFNRRDHRPTYLHGCTSISIPEAFIYLDSGQLAGLQEGVAGAAYYGQQVTEKYVEQGLGRESEKASSAAVAMTSLSVAHFVIIFFIVLGNLGLLWPRIRRWIAGRARG